MYEQNQPSNCVFIINVDNFYYLRIDSVNICKKDLTREKRVQGYVEFVPGDKPLSNVFKKKGLSKDRSR